MAPRLCVVGLSHRTAPVEVRERVAFSEEALAAAPQAAVGIPGVGEAMIVSTCNRVELYAGVGRAPDALERGSPRFLARAARLARPSRCAAHLYNHDGEAALLHLFRVAASLDSMVLGEPQILGQVKEAFAPRQRARAPSGTLLGRALPRAFAVAKRVRTETDIARSSASIASAAVELAQQIFGNLKGRQVLVVGAGQDGRALGAAPAGRAASASWWSSTARARAPRRWPSSWAGGRPPGRSWTRCSARSTSCSARRARRSRSSAARGWSR